MKRRALGALVVVLAVPPLAASCTGDTEEASVRSLERTGRAAFVCLGKPGNPSALNPLSACTNDRQDTPNDFNATSENDGSAKHLYALLTLETRGELAVVDLTTETAAVLDHDVSTPGDNPLPVGAQPTDVVATPMGTAVFVASAENGRPAIYAIGAERLRPCEVEDDQTRDCGKPPATLSSWPACKLDSAPGTMVLVADPPDAEGRVRTSCGADYDTEGGEPSFDDIDGEGLGRQKLYVTQPRLGRVIVLDAQELFSRDPGSFDECEVEATIELSANPNPPAPPEIPDGPACAVPPESAPDPAVDDFTSIPAGLALSQTTGGAPGASGSMLYVADIGAPLIHVLDLADPCEPFEAAPLYPTSLEDPSRAVLTQKIAVSGLTPSERRYMYATDVEDKSVMAFDITEGSAQSTPLTWAHPEQNPFQPPDRIRFASPPVDVSILERDSPKDDGSGVAPIGTLCDPDPSAVTCNGEDPNCDRGTLYRTSDDFETGAGPATFRGVFGMIALASGQIAMIDIEDFDGPCRGPVDQDAAFGCDGDATELKTTGELTCNVVLPHQPRAGAYVLTNDDVGRHQPGIQTFPVLSLEDGTVVTDGPAMRAPTGSVAALQLAVGGDLLAIDPSVGAIVDDEGVRNTLLLTFANPRVHQIDQNWALIYQGALPDFVGHVGDLALGDSMLTDTTANFCEHGVQSEAAIRAQLEVEGLTGAELDAGAARLADRLHVSEPLADSDDPIWEGAACSFADCRATFGEATVPTAARDIRILEARQDRLDLAAPEGTTPEFFECCFPTLVDYEIRPGDEWVLIGGASGFIHNTIADEAEDGVCRPSCDPRLAERVSRARYIVGETTVEPPAADDSRVFHNALFDFAIVVPGNEEGVAEGLHRDMAFRFATTASFEPLRIQLTNDDRRSVQTQSMGYLPSTDEIFVTDGALEGLLLVPGDLDGEIRQFF